MNRRALLRGLLAMPVAARFAPAVVARVPLPAPATWAAMSTLARQVLDQIDDVLVQLVWKGYDVGAFQRAMTEALTHANEKEV